MKKAVTLFLLVIASAPARAAVSDLDWNRMGDAAAVGKSWQALRKWEPMTRDWHQHWPYQESKKQAIKEITFAFKELERIQAKDQNNVELCLALGLAAHYLYNLDESRYDARARKYYAAAEKLNPADIRPQWFDGTHAVQSLRLKEGMEKLLAVSRLRSPNTFPFSFWEDFASGAYISGMPVNALRALDLSQTAGSPNVSYINEMRRLINTSYFEIPSATQTYTQIDSWFVMKNSSLTFCSRPFAFCFESKENWSLTLAPAKEGNSWALITPNAYQGPAGTVTATMMIAAEVAKSTQSLATVLNYGVPKSAVTKKITLNMPYVPYEAIEIRDKNMYADLGGAHLVKVVFSRPDPIYPGLASEEPRDLPLDKKSVFLTPIKKLVRFKGTVIYTLMLDIADALYVPARTDFDRLLSTLTVE